MNGELQASVATPVKQKSGAPLFVVPCGLSPKHQAHWGALVESSGLVVRMVGLHFDSKDFESQKLATNCVKQ